MRKFLTLITAICFATSGSWSLAQEGELVAIKIPGSGTYTAPISTDLAEAQAFFDQGLRMAWSFIFPNPLRLSGSFEVRSSAPHALLGTGTCHWSESEQ